MGNKEHVFVIFDVYNTLFSPRKGLYDDVKPALEMLKENNIFIGIISSLSKEYIEEILRTYNIEDKFDVIMSVREYDTLKPDPKLIRIAITLLKDKIGKSIKKENVYYIGDRPDVDVRMANLAGIKSIRIIRGKYATKEEEGEIEKPTYTIEFLTELKDILNLKMPENNKKQENDVEII